MSTTNPGNDVEFIAATAATVTLYFQHGLALMASEFGIPKCNADSPALAGFVQACAAIHAAELLSTELDASVGERLIKITHAIEQTI